MQGDDPGGDAAIDERRRRAGRDLRPALAAILAVAVGLLGVLMAHHPMILSGMRRMQTDLGDTRFNHYLIEHAYLWLAGAPGHSRFWTPGFFFPARNTGAYSDVFLSVAPLYGVGRLMGLPADTSFQLWMMATSALNYLVALHMLRVRFRLGTAAACAGAFLFAFGAPRVNQMNHQQLLPQFLGLVTIDALLGVFPGEGTTARRRVGLWLAAAVGLAAQFYAGFYLGWFLVLAIGIAAVVALGMPSTRIAFLSALGRDRVALGAGLLLAAALLYPLAARYLSVARVEGIGTRTHRDSDPYLVDGASFVNTGPNHWLWGWTSRAGVFSPAGEEEKRLGIGLITTAACLVGFAWNRGSARVLLLAIAAVLLLACVATVPRGPAFGLALGVCLLAQAALLGARDEHPRVRWLVPAAVLVFLLIDRIPSWEARGVVLFALIAGLAVLHRDAIPARTRLLVAGEALLIAATLFAVKVLALGAVVGGLTACAAWVLGLRAPRRVGLVAVAVTLLFASLTTFGDHPIALLVAGSAPLWLALAGPAARALPAPWAFPALLVALAALVVYQTTGAAWITLAPVIPGASAVRAVSRVGVVLLVAWAIGLGLFVQGMLARRRPVGALLVALACMLEQGVTTGSYDKDEHRSAVAALSRRIGHRPVAFYYTAHGGRRPVHAYQLDAMWAGLERGVPTINGYSGNFPPGWSGLFSCNVEDDCELICLEDPLRRWIAAGGLAPQDVDWVGGPPGWPGAAGPAQR